MRQEIRTVTIFESAEEYAAYLRDKGICFLCDGPWPHDENGCPTFQEAED